MSLATTIANERAELQSTCSEIAARLAAMHQAIGDGVKGTELVKMWDELRACIQFDVSARLGSIVNNEAALARVRAVNAGERARASRQRLVDGKSAAAGAHLELEEAFAV